MTSNVLKVKMIKGRFSVNVVLKLDYIGDRAYNCKAIIDTGCSFTSVNALSIGVSKDKAIILKQEDILNNSVQKRKSYGVSDSTEIKNIEDEIFNNKDYMKLKSVSFVHSCTYFDIDGLRIEDVNVKVNYDRDTPVLIGMNIIKNWKTYIDTDSKGDTYLIACQKDNVTEEFYQEIENTFGLGSEFINNLM